MSLGEQTGFLRSDSKSWVSSSLFFMSINKLKLKDTIYHLPTGHTFSNEQLAYYVDALCDELLSVDVPTEDKEAYDYVRKITGILRRWAKEGYSLKVV